MGDAIERAKSQMLDELCADYEYERKYAIKLLGGTLPVARENKHRPKGVRDDY